MVSFAAFILLFAALSLPPKGTKPPAAPTPQQRMDEERRKMVQFSFLVVKRMNDKVILKNADGGIHVLQVGKSFKQESRHYSYGEYTLIAIEDDGPVFDYTWAAAEQGTHQGRFKLPWDSGYLR